MWTLTLVYEDETTETLPGYLTRTDAREMSKWYRTMCEENGPKKVIRTPITHD